MFVGIKFRKRIFKEIGLVIISSSIRLDIFQYILQSSGRVRGGGGVMDPLGRKLEKNRKNILIGLFVSSLQLRWKMSDYLTF